VPRHDPSRSWLLEILGFWTPEYLREKQKRLQAAGIERFLLCVDQNRECTEPDPAPDPRIIRYRSRIDCRALLAIITANS
jgi:predicted nuclease of restriction endonuclease-like RecB superfamily